MRSWIAAALFATLAACGGVTGTFTLELKTAPGSTILDGVTRARLTLSVPYRQVEATRGDDGKFHLSIDVPAEGPSGQLTFEGFDAAGNVVAWGRSGVLPIAAIDANVSIYVAPPVSLAAAPVSLDPPRTDIGVTRFNFGVLLVGGADATGAPVDKVQVYDVYDHLFLGGEDMPAPRAGASVAAGVTGYAYVFGGRGPNGTTGTFWRFDTTVEPSGQWLEIDEQPLLSRAGAAIAPVRTEGFVVTGDPPVLLDGISISATAIASAPAMAGTATAVQLNDTIFTVIVGEGTGMGGIATIGPEGITEHTDAPTARRTGHGAAGTRDAEVVVLGGAIGGVPTATAIRVRPATDVFIERPSTLATPRVDAAVGGNGVYAIVAGGRDAGGAILGDAEVFELETLERVGVIPMVVPRTGAVAASLASGQILVLGGVDAAGAPVGTIEIFNPPAPENP
ncbi:MAG TPA: hypothetical protein VM261_30545 [Kofleriaceae bacterium]|nr:hypothetical protein [Kofleriaceae bacterium]